MNHPPARSGGIFVVRPAVLAALLFAPTDARPSVVINEFMSAPSERQLRYDSAGMPRVGSGIPWHQPAFPAAGWSHGGLPAGYGFAGLATSLQSAMQNKTPSLYLRKTFVVSAADAASGSALSLLAECNDGFVAWLNGVEVARSNVGAPNHLVYHDQPAYNPAAAGGLMEYPLGAASTRLVAGTNVLALQVHNAEQPGSATNQSLYDQHLPTPEFKINAGVRLAGTTDLVAPGTEGGDWNYFVGLAEPSGGVFDPGLLSGYVPPPGEETDYENLEDFVDWLELRNSGASPVDLSAWSLSDDPQVPDKWKFPSGTVLAAGGFLIVLCDDREEANAPAGPARRLHANFRLNGDGDSLFLSDSSGALVDQITGVPNQTSFQSYGRNPSNEAEWGYLDVATPGGENSGTFFSARCEPPESFQSDGVTPLPGGRYTGTQTLTLVSATPGAVIRYTMNGSEPTESNGTVFAAPVSLTAAGDRNGRVIRARAFKAGLLASGVKTHTYLINQNAALARVPALILTGTAGETFYKPHGILGIQGGTYQSTSSGTVWVHNGPTSYNIALGQGRPFERETHLEFHAPPGYYPSSQEPLRQDIGIRLSSSPYQRPRMRLATTNNSPWGPWWDATERPSFNLYWRGDFGPAELDYPLFPGYDVRNFQSLRLRAGKNDSGGDSPFITDELVRRLWIDMGHVGSKGLICALYVNGQWKNIGNLTERIREPLLQEHYRSERPWDVRYVYEWVNGDSAAWNQMMSALNANPATLPNYQTIGSRLDVDNFADYYLLNIYSAMWDWPENNFALARERSTGPDSVFRYLVWDAEGGFNVKSYYAKGVSFNTITSDLQGKNVDVANIWRRLVLSPEWRLKFADRINRHLFNGGVLDDRDPDAGGPLKSHFKRRIDDLAAEAGPMVQLYSGMTYATTLTAFSTWMNPSTGRRSYLLGNAANQRYFRNAGLWPATEPPILSQHGGVVPAGYNLTMTSTVATAGQSADIYYTRDGTDPRLAGGALSPAATAYAGSAVLDSIGTIKARARNTTTGEWSALTEATFLVAAVPATASNLVVTELMYHPPDATAAEEAAGYNNADDFEFIRLTNIGSGPVDLRGAAFTAGVTFDFSSGGVIALNPGAHVVVVRNRAAFLMRYGSGLAPLIAGEFTGGLANDGERLALAGDDGPDAGTERDILHDFGYLDEPPWPAAADGDGPSLILMSPASNPDHSTPANWTSSAVVGGLPAGTPRALGYAEWRALVWNPADAADETISGPGADNDGDGLANLVEFATGFDPRQSDGRAAITIRIELMGDDRFLIVEFRQPGSLSGVSVVPQVSSDAMSWLAGPAHLVDHIAPAAQADGSVLHVIRHTTPVGSATRRFVRLRVDIP